MNVRSWMPSPDKPRAVIIALHGFNDYSNFFDAPGTFLADQGIAAYAYDQRGFGETPRRGIWPGVKAFSDDLTSFTRLVKKRHPDIPVFLLGASMGGAVVMVAMTSQSPPDVDGVILAGPAVWGRATMPWYQRMALWVGSHTVPWMKLTGRGLKIKASDNREMLIALGRDPLIIKATRIDAIYGVVNLMDAAFDAGPHLKDKALFLYGELDEVVPKSPTYKMLKALPGAARARQVVAIYEKGYHMLLRGLEAETVWRDIATWTFNPHAPLPSKAEKRANKVLK